MSIDAATGRLLIDIARRAITSAVSGEDAFPPASAAILRERRGVFVTLTCGGRLRGCIGRIEPDEPLAITLPDVAVLSATGDPRFPRVAVEELEELDIEVSLLTVPVPAEHPPVIEIGRHGLIVEASGRRGLLLPQVATEYGWTADEFLNQVCVKAGLAPNAWRSPEVRIQTFEADIVTGGN